MLPAYVAILRARIRNIAMARMRSAFAVGTLKNAGKGRAVVNQVLSERSSLSPRSGLRAARQTPARVPACRRVVAVRPARYAARACLPSLPLMRYRCLCRLRDEKRGRVGFEAVRHVVPSRPRGEPACPGWRRRHKGGGVVHANAVVTSSNIT